MIGCYNSGDFKKYFNENMSDLGLPVPQTLFDSYSAAIANTGLILEAIRTLGKKATMGQVIKATTVLEKLKVAAAIGASYYVGAVIGSIAVASGRSLGCGYKISDMFVFIDRHNLRFDDWNAFYVKNPEIMDKNYPSRFIYGSKAKSWVYAS